MPATRHTNVEQPTKTGSADACLTPQGGPRRSYCSSAVLVVLVAGACSERSIAPSGVSLGAGAGAASATTSANQGASSSIFDDPSENRAVGCAAISDINLHPPCSNKDLFLDLGCSESSLPDQVIYNFLWQPDLQEVTPLSRLQLVLLPLNEEDSTAAGGAGGAGGTDSAALTADPATPYPLLPQVEPADLVEFSGDTFQVREPRLSDLELGIAIEPQDPELSTYLGVSPLSRDFPEVYVIARVALMEDEHVVDEQRVIFYPRSVCRFP